MAVSKCISHRQASGDLSSRECFLLRLHLCRRALEMFSFLFEPCLSVENYSTHSKTVRHCAPLFSPGGGIVL
ncbi:hypothetical protein PSP6_260028 [Paraburkholderia tropica]|nr:hypothetical protein PSP6_260028 [Paraburkholderia tropica]